MLRIISDITTGFLKHCFLSRTCHHPGFGFRVRISSVSHVCCVKGNQVSFKGPCSRDRVNWWQKGRPGLIALWQRDPVQTLFCRLGHEVQLVRKTALLSITQYLSVLTVLEEIVCTHEKDTHVHSVWRYSCLTRDMWQWITGSFSWIDDGGRY